ncbi:MAG: transferrin-binding protein-like solute binding protein [Sphingomicrobium sp.]
MAHYLKCMMAASIAISLGACGGGGGGGIASTPAPPAPAPPAPPPLIPAAVVGAPAPATAPNGTLFPRATPGGPTFQAQPMTVFPLLQTVMSSGSGTVRADTATMSGGATLTFDSIAANANDDSYRFNVGNAALGVSDVLLSFQPSSGTYGASLSNGGTATLNRLNLSWTSFGSWAVVMPDRTRTDAAFVTGYQTPVASVPTTGTATYYGSTSGKTFHPQQGEVNGARSFDITGTATLQANFASGVITGNLTNMLSNASWDDMVPWNSVSLVASISGGQFTGTSAATSSPGTYGTLSASATGTFNGMFFGPSAQELGAVWTLSDGTGSAIGTIGATTTPPSPWDY